MTRHTLTGFEQLSVIILLRNLFPASFVATKFQISTAAVSHISGRQKKIVDAISKDGSLLHKRRLFTGPKYAAVEEKLVETISSYRELGYALLETDLKHLALKIGGEILDPKKKKKFTASRTWIRSFRRRHKIVRRRICGELKSANTTLAVQYRRIIQSYISENNYKPEQVFNADETPLFYRQYGDHTYSLSSELKVSGVKLKKERITALLGTNQFGDFKTKPLYIGKSATPRCFKDTDLSHKPYIYMHSKSAWMTKDLFGEWYNNHFMHEVQKYLRDKNIEERCLLLVDNFSGHQLPTEVNDGPFKVIFLPPNTTALIQPMDQHICACVKANYKKRVREAILMRDSDGNIRKLDDALKAIDLEFACDTATDCWNKVSNSAVRDSWRAITKDLTPLETDIANNSAVMSIDESGKVVSDLIFKRKREDDSKPGETRKKAEVDDSNEVIDVSSDEDASESDISGDSDDESDDAASDAEDDADDGFPQYCEQDFGVKTRFGRISKFSYG